MNNTNQPEFLEEDVIDIRKLIEKYSWLWPYIVLFIIVGKRVESTFWDTP